MPPTPFWLCLRLAGDVPRRSIWILPGFCLMGTRRGLQHNARIATFNWSWQPHWEDEAETQSISIFHFFHTTEKRGLCSIQKQLDFLLNSRTSRWPRQLHQHQQQSSNSSMTSSSNPGLHHRAPHAAADHQQQQPSEHLSSSSTQHPADVEAAISAEPASQKGGDGGHKDVGSDPSADAGGQELQQPEQYTDVTYADIFKQFSILGWTAFGGPAAHIGLFQRVSCCTWEQQMLLCIVLHAAACPSTPCNLDCASYSRTHTLVTTTHNPHALSPPHTCPPPYLSLPLHRHRHPLTAAG